MATAPPNREAAPAWGSCCDSSTASNRPHHAPPSEVGPDGEDVHDQGDVVRRVYRAVDRVLDLSVLKNLLSEDDETRPWWTRLDKNLILGAIPCEQHVEALTSLYGVTAVVTLNQPHELEANLWVVPVPPETWKSVGVVQCHESAPDFAPPTQAQLGRCADFIHQQIESNPSGSVYIHCKAGRGRSTMATMCYLIRYRALDYDMAWEWIQSKRPHVKFNDFQRGGVKTFAAAHLAQA